MSEPRPFSEKESGISDRESPEKETGFRKVRKEPDSEHEYCNCKIGKACRKHDLKTFYDTIGDRYLGNGGRNQSSTREIAEELNKKIIQANTYESGYDGDYSVNDMYSMFVEDSLPHGEELKKKLEEQDVDTEHIDESTASYITIYRHLKNCLGISSEDRKPSREESINNAEQYILDEIEECRNKIRRKIEDTEGIELSDDKNIVVDVSVTDPDGFPSNLDGEIDEFDSNFNTGF
ncbi:MAG: rod-determining factor RdfA [Halobacteria archaeon]